ncbi:hypothetical protein JTB14_017899 [Gonioctena quinquepunctata]|nr:hypothetical protein JTB14_017899 [Gonioctena quinquepunctata]
MSTECGFCNSVISGRAPAIQCQGHCNKTFHLKCMKLPSCVTELFQNSGIFWKCPTCKKSQVHADSIVLHKLGVKLDAMMKEVAEVKNNQSEVFSSIRFFSDKLDEFTNQMEEVKSMSSTMDKIQQHLVTVETDNKTMRGEMETLQQQNRAAYIEICGIPEKKGKI